MLCDLEALQQTHIRNYLERRCHAFSDRSVERGGERAFGFIVIVPRVFLIVKTSLFRTKR